MAEYKKNLWVKLFSFILVNLVFLIPVKVSAQQNNDDLENRVYALEKYVETIQPILTEFSSQVQNNILEYTKELEGSLQNYSNKLQYDVNNRINKINNRIVNLDVGSGLFQKITTNIGDFLISIDKAESIEGGYRLYMNIGNPNFADYKDFKIKLTWGEKWVPPGHAISYDQWRNSLHSTEFTFQGLIKKGEWNPVEVDLIPASATQLEYMECELNILSVELKSK